jgi:ABC-type nitrate/sulfonate/bicarbonate transport system permease component
MNPKSGTIISFGAFVAILLGWQAAYELKVVSSTILPSPTLIIMKGAELIKSGLLVTNAASSLSLIIAAILLACLIGVPLGLAMGTCNVFENVFHPFIELARPVPPLALLPLAILWFGIGVEEKLFLLVMGTFPPIVINTFHGVRSADPILLRAARSMGASNVDILWKVLFPSALASIFVGLRIAAGFAFTVIVAAELVATKEGLGYLLIIGWRTYDLELIFVVILTIGLLSYLVDLLIRVARKRIVSWEDPDTISIIN